jgi:hypothetical protein
MWFGSMVMILLDEGFDKSQRSGRKKKKKITGVVEMEFGMTGLIYFVRVQGRMK